MDNIIHIALKAESLKHAEFQRETLQASSLKNIQCGYMVVVGTCTCANSLDNLDFIFGSHSQIRMNSLSILFPDGKLSSFFVKEVV